MRNGIIGLAAGIALLSATQAQAAEKACLTRPELRGMISYVMPSLMGAVVDKCRPALAASAPLIVRGSQLRDEYRAGQSAAFPMARQAFAKFSGDDKGSETFQAMPESVLKPLIETIAAKQLTDEIKASNCADIDRVFATLQPLPSGNFVDLLAEVVAIGSRGNPRMQVCGA